METQPTCGCPDPALCDRLKRHINGRLWDIWNGNNIDPKVADSYRRLWERQAGIEVKEDRPAQGPIKSGCGCGGKR